MVGVPELVPPTVEVRASFLAAMEEFRCEGRGRPEDQSGIGDELRAVPWGGDEAGFAGYVAALRAEALPETPRAEDRVACTTLWWLDGKRYLGRIAVRHVLNAWLREYGGHIGYDVRPSARRRGHATAMLAAALPVAASMGIGSALITCDDDNVASRRVIESAGGVLQDQRGRKLRFWVPTHPGTGSPDRQR